MGGNVVLLLQKKEHIHFLLFFLKKISAGKWKK